MSPKKGAFVSDYREAFIGQEDADWNSEYFKRPESREPSWSAQTPADRALYLLLRKCIRIGPNVEYDEEQLEQIYSKSSLPQKFERIFFVLYAPGNSRILVTRAYSETKWTFAKVFWRLLHHERRQELAQRPFALQIDFQLMEKKSVELYRVGMRQRGERHFEIGVDGLALQDEGGQPRYFLPGDAFVRSIMGMRQLRDYLGKSYGEKFLRTAQFQRFRTESYLVGPEKTIRLYRGIPLIGELRKPALESAVVLARDHIKKTQQKDGKFLYYYDPAVDSYRDFEHPGRDLKKNPYYNILRHSGGGLACIYYEKYNKAGDTLENMRRAIDYLRGSAVFYSLDGCQAAYIYSERKSKLGGAGIGLYFLAEYQLLTGDDSYEEFVHALARHTLAQITDTGEFIYYNIYLDEVITPETNANYFSFYYPGEALCGLAKYLHLLEPTERTPYYSRIKLAMDYLLNIRPKERASEYTEVPSDSWLMMGVMELWDFEEMRDPAYADFVFGDARRMVQQMYKVTDSPYPDYAGAFYYQFGDYPYSDGARLEGLMGAYELALKMGEEKVARLLWSALKLGAWSVMHLVNTSDTLYSAKKPELALGGIRFKFTRQWFRIDTIQHVACFFAKMLPHWDEAERRAKREVH